MLETVINPRVVLSVVYYKNEEGLRFLRTVLRYIEKGSGLNKDDVQQTIEKANPLIREEYMTLYEQHIREGMERGMDIGFQKGVVRDKQDVIIKQLSKKFTLTEEEKSIMLKIEDPEILDQGLDEVLFAETKEQVLKVLR